MKFFKTSSEAPPKERSTCPRCNGTGSYRVQNDMLDSNYSGAAWHPHVYPCPDCGGAGLLKED